MIDKELEKKLAEAFKAGYEYGRDQAYVSDYNGWTRTAPYIEWPTYENVNLESLKYAYVETRKEPTNDNDC